MPQEKPEGADLPDRDPAAEPESAPDSGSSPSAAAQPGHAAPVGYGAAEGYGLGNAPAPAPSTAASAAGYQPRTTTVRTEGPSLGARLGAEVFGTFLVVLAGLGTALYASYTGAQTLGVALAFGIGAAVAYLVVGRVSGGHFNPAITLGAVLAGRTRAVDLILYWIAQVVGGALASSVLYLTLSTFPALAGSERSFFAGVANGYDAHSQLAVSSGLEQGFTLMAALLIEAVATAVLVGVFLAVTDSRRGRDTGRAALGIGGTLAVLILVATPMTNAGLNPARSTAAALFSESWVWGELWVFWVAPLFGAAIAALLYRGFVGGEELDDDLEDDLDDDELDGDVVIEEDTTVIRRD